MLLEVVQLGCVGILIQPSDNEEATNGEFPAFIILKVESELTFQKLDSVVLKYNFLCLQFFYFLVVGLRKDLLCHSDPQDVSQLLSQYIPLQEHEQAHLKECLEKIQEQDQFPKLSCLLYLSAEASGIFLLHPIKRIIRKYM